MDGVQEPSQRLGLAGVPGAHDHRARPAADRGEPLDGLEGRVLGAQREPLVRIVDRQLVVANAVCDGVGRGAVDGVDADERGVALGAPRRAHRPGHAVARDELAATDLRGGDVDVLV